MPLLASSDRRDVLLHCVVDDRHRGVDLALRNREWRRHAETVPHAPNGPYDVHRQPLAEALITHRLGQGVGRLPRGTVFHQLETHQQPTAPDITDLLITLSHLFQTA